MQTWSSVDVPNLPSIGLPLRLRDSATGEIRPTSPGRTARMYVCGITPYDATHMGHASTYLAFDMVHRLWIDSGHDVHYVQNITDVDDPLLERAIVTGQDWTEIAAREIALFKTDMEALRVLPPQHYIGAVESIPLVIEYIEALRNAGAVYEVDGDLYFSVTADRHFGSVSHLGVDEMLPIFAERGGDPERPGKADPLDCLLWMRERPGEPSWESPFGPGRPGWHIECVAIALHHLGMSFDVQGGGSDLVFPHHEMGAAQAQVATGLWPFARHFVHAGMVAYEGHKMSKSRGNLVFVSKLREAGIDPMAIRLALLAHHYRSDWEWTDDDLRSAESRLATWRQAAWADHGPDAHGLLERVRERLSDDLDTPAALAAIDHWSQEAVLRPGSSAEGPELVRRMCDALLGVTL